MNSMEWLGFRWGRGECRCSGSLVQSMNDW